MQDPNEKSSYYFKSKGISRKGETYPLHQWVRRTAYSLKKDDEDTPMKAGRRRSAEKSFKYLIKAGAKIAQPDKWGMTPLHWAANDDNVRAAEILLGASAPLNRKDFEGKRPKDYAKSAAMIKLLTTKKSSSGRLSKKKKPKRLTGSGFFSFF